MIGSLFSGTTESPGKILKQMVNDIKYLEEWVQLSQLDLQTDITKKFKDISKFVPEELKELLNLKVQ